MEYQNLLEMFSNFRKFLVTRFFFFCLQESFWTNPKFFVTLKEEDDGNKDSRCTMIVALLQKPPKESRSKTKLLNIGFSVFPVSTSTEN